MFINFSNITVHNFLSWGHAEINLIDKHYCVVTGQNNKIEDNATNNGSGKSSLFSAISWALTGETIQGLSTNIKNLYIDEDSCYVILEFSIDNNHYKVTRYKNPKPNLVIYLNGLDISGKGLRESEAILKQHLPDLSSQLLASIIILGQGLPYRFTDNTPSGRKEVLEKLSKSDFMIQDLKDRINNRSIFLNESLRSYQDKLLADTSKKDLLQKQYEEQNQKLVIAKEPKNFTVKISELKDEEIKVTENINNDTTKIIKFEEQEQEILNKLNVKNNEKSDLLKEEDAQFYSFAQEYYNKRSDILVAKNSLSQKIADIEAITDICPTCGQKIPNIEKPNCDNEKLELAQVEKQLEHLDKTYENNKHQHLDYQKNINESYDKETNELTYELKKVKTNLDVFKLDKKNKENQLLQIRSKIFALELEEKNYLETIKTIENTLYNLDLSIKKLDEEILYNNKNKETTSAHIEVINKMNSLIKRDFRGFLLSEIINYIAYKVKEYSVEVFNNDDLAFALEGNNINISYSGRAFENLSGGEKQKVDLIIQFAIRDMMQHYLDFSSNILVLDEIFDQLDINGCTNILTLIMHKLTDVESIFIISHRANELEIPYDCEMLVIKDEKGVSSIRWQ